MELVVIISLFAIALIWISLTPLKADIESSSPLTFLSVVICFRDEEASLPRLLHCIEKSSEASNLVLEFLLIDDHSIDASQATIAKANLKNLKCLMNEGNGKKRALKTGVEAAKFDHILFLDADVHFSDDYFDELQKFVDSEAELTVLPAIPEGRHYFLDQFQLLEFLCMSLTSKSFERFRPPMLCNGANLLVQKASWKSVLKDLHFGLASGDDIFLLQALKKRNRRIDSLHNKSLRVYFEVETTWKNFFKQRIRWGSKATRYSDYGLLAVGYFMIMTQLALVLLLIFTLLQKIDVSVVLWLLIALQVICMTLIRNGLKKHFDVAPHLFACILFPMVYPFYLLISTFLSLIKRSTWKGRRV